MLSSGRVFVVPFAGGGDGFFFILRTENTELLTGDERSLALHVKGI